MAGGPDKALRHVTNEPSSSPPLAPDHVKVGARRKLRQYLGPTRGERAYGFLQFWELVFTGFINNRCPVRATALAYTTLLALIPMIAVAASISTSILKSQGDAPIKRAIDKLVEQITPNLEDARLVDANTTTAAVEPVPSASGVSTNAVALTDEQRRKLGELAQTVDRNKIARRMM